MAALRLARAYTGKDSYILIEGGYHGLFDAAMWMANMDQWDPGSGPIPQTVPYSRGIPQRLKDLVYLTPMNDANRLEDIFKKHSEQYRRHADRADHGQLLRHLGDHRIRPARAQALRQLRRAADHR